MRILHVTAEMAPFAKVGGLADVLQGLTAELVRQGHDVTVAMPHYSHIDIPGSINGVKIVTFADPAFEAGAIYTSEGDRERFLKFCGHVKKWYSDFDIVHLHDWHAAILARDLEAKTVLTIHNLEHQGGDLLELGIRHADHITTVSRTYAEEILTPEYGCGLQNVLKTRPISGIVNGLDESYWSPKNDPHVSENKKINKRNLQQELGLEVGIRPIVAAVTRLVPQKGIDLLESAYHATLKRGGQFVLLGSSPIPEIQSRFASLKNHAQARIVLGYHEHLAHKIYGGANLFLVPSLFEPCGLTQLIALKYGALPLVRETGGLKDTIQDLKNGFTFKEPKAEVLEKTLDRALNLWFEEPDTWHRLTTAAQSADYSWKKPAEIYYNIYNMI